MLISEIFLTIQGEGVESGIPTIFIRTFGCNLDCDYCDTNYARITKQKGSATKDDGIEMTISEILKRIKEYVPYKAICITGGEPLIQIDITLLVSELVAQDYEVWIETGGGVDLEVLGDIIQNPKVHIVLDIKGPSSKMENRMKNNWGYLQEGDQVKFLIKDMADFEFAKKIIRTKLHHIPVTVLLSSVAQTEAFDQKTLTAADIVNLILTYKLRARVNMQLHKIIWKSSKRGV